MAFAERLAFGQIAESYIALWLRRKHGFSVLPVYEKEIDTGKGPRYFLPQGELVAPDLLAIRFRDPHRKDRILWIEAKHKTVFSWHRKTLQWVTGIDLHHYGDYLCIAKQTPWPIWLLFLHQSDQPAPYDVKYGCPKYCPTGLFAGELLALSQRENHRHNNWGPHGMVYWNQNTLTLLATLEEIGKIVRQPERIRVNGAAI